MASVDSPPGPVASVLEIARHELVTAFRTRRVLIVASLYVLGALAGASVYAFTLKKLREVAVAELVASGGMSPAQAEGVVSLVGSRGYDEILARYAGVAVEALSPVFQQSVVLP